MLEKIISIKKKNDEKISRKNNFENGGKKKDNLILEKCLKKTPTKL